ncbi:MAG TPA: hypothetical protein VK066_11280 [Chloroflexota bacterium]|nr:hypothetical protein [Chloroflexota bacterium]
MTKATLRWLVLLLMLGGLVLHGPSPARAADDDCSGVSDWVDYLYQMRDQADDLSQREADLSRDDGLTTEELAAGLAAVANDREALSEEFQQHPVPPAAEAVQTAYALAWELDGLVGNAYLRAVRSDDERLRGLADGYSEASGTITTRAAQLLDQLLERCR